MQLAFLTPEYPHKRTGKTGGLGTSIFTLANELAQQHVEVHVLIYGQKEMADWVEEGVHLHLIPQKKYAVGNWYLYPQFVNAYVNQQIKRYGIQLIEVADYTGFTAFMQFPVPTVMRLHGSDSYFCELEQRKQKWKNRWLETLAFRKADYHIAPTQFAGQLTQEVLGSTRYPVAVIPHGIDLSQFTPSSNSEFTPFQLVYIGTLIRKKGVIALAAIFNRVIEQCPQASLLLVGNDSADQLTGSTSTWELIQNELTVEALERVVYLGPRPYTEVQRHLSQAQIVVLPTLAETFGLVTIEAMALAKTVVSSDKGWVSELLENGTSGFQCDPHNTQEFADLLVELLNDPERCKSIGKQARLQVEKRFEIHTIVKKNRAFYQNILDG